jgi:hypothetical protein
MWAQNMLPKFFRGKNWKNRLCNKFFFSPFYEVRRLGAVFNEMREKSMGSM